MQQKASRDIELDQRILEPELMDDAEQAAAYARTDFSSAHDMFVLRFAELFGADFHGRVVELGCGPGDVVRRFARANPRAYILGIDGAPAMLEQAAIYTEADAECKVRIEYMCRLLPEVGDLEPADAVISNSVLHHLHQPGVLWEAVKLLARTGAPIFVMDLFRPASTGGAQDIVDQYAADADEILKRDFYHSLCAALRVDEVRAQLASAGLDFLQVAQVSDRHLAVWGRAQSGG